MNPKKINPRPYCKIFRFYPVAGLITFMILLAACAPQRLLPEGPTPIPTLIPATLGAEALAPTPTARTVAESYPAGLPSAQDGQALYEEHCASCHGVDGQGEVPNSRDFSDVDYMRGETPVEFYNIISEGRGEGMPGFGEQLTSDQRWNLVYYVWRFSTSEEILRQGAEIYQQDCASCHGEDGRSMILGAANFSDHRFLANQSPSDLYVVVTQGEGSMPAWQARLSQDERWAVINYIRTFNYAPTISGEIPEIEPEPITTEAPRAECEPYLDQTNPFAWDDAEAAAAGEAIYSSCAGCHGEEGTGSLPGIVDFTDPLFQNKLRQESGEVFCSTAEGINGMPAWKDQLSEEQIWQVLTYIASLGGQ
ncbi:MAG: c-type cytochrome [Anaerolineales bacterium]|jgi:mono/diheme cytochrome c family protein